jgi:anti-anti-sigma factor
MKLKYEDHDKISIVSIDGDMTADHVDSFRRTVGERINKGTRDFVLQVEGLTFIDSAGLESLLWLQEAAAEHLGQIRLVAPEENIRKILEITRLQHQFDVHEEVTDAIRSLR